MRNNNFRVGDKVVCRDSSRSWDNLEEGRVYTIKDTGMYHVILDELDILWFFSHRFELIPNADLNSSSTKDEIMEPKFKVGDIVEAFGVHGQVIDIDSYKKYSHIKVLFDNGLKIYFMADGRLNDWHKEPSLKFIERPIPYITKTVEVWGNLYADGHVQGHPTRDLADSHECGRIDCVRLTGTYKVEEGK